MTGSSGMDMGRLLLAIMVLGAGLTFLAGCMGTTPSMHPGAQPATTMPAVLSYMMHVPGNNHRNVVLLVGKASCPHCHDARAFLANQSVDYYWVDLDTLDQANVTAVLSSLSGVCGQVEVVPVLVINDRECIIGFNETRIREVLG